ncbi:bifunctional DNA primase/polymerase [Nonomuraea typhae]|uniref:bifunctional DNA primase/polymerase n=1 Tax=Nonomuraea typhae TaxID=2603600 RepID=UPI0012FB61EF|nr:bifunctional DNA primase/polymerase [Nonomuraea typhae]
MTPISGAANGATTISYYQLAATPATISITPETSAYEALLAYAACGWKPFLLSSGKVPTKNCDYCDKHHLTNDQREACTHVTCHGFYAATSDPERLREMAGLIPRGLVAIRTGAPSGLVVLDIDSMAGHGVDGYAAAERGRKAGYLPDTVVQRTPSGGMHLLYAHPGGRIKGGSNRLGRGLDVKADGGYFVTAPSVSSKTGQAYRWDRDTIRLPLTPLHHRLADYLREKPLPEKARRAPDLPQLRDRYVSAAVAGEVQAIMDAPKGGKGRPGRCDQLNKSAFILGTLVGAGALDQAAAERALTDAAYGVGLDVDPNCGPSQITRTIRSGLTAGMRHPRRLQGVR